jgi:uncharacterized membrane-anchored protein
MGLLVQVAYVAVLNADVSRDQEFMHLAKLSGQKGLTRDALDGNFLRLPAGPCTLRWERHTEFTAYSVVRALPPSTLLNDPPQQLVSQLLLEDDWLANIPGNTLLAVHLVMMLGDPPQAMNRAGAYDHWFGDGSAVASMMGSPTHSSVVTNFAVQSDGFERILVLAAPGMGEARVGRVAQRLLELETYRLLALRSMPVAKQLAPELADCERVLLTITEQLDDAQSGNQEVLEALLALACRVESAVAKHRTGFEASTAYHALVTQRLEELQEKAIPGTQTLGEFVRRRLSPEVATITATVRRMEALSARVGRASALLRARTQVSLERQGQQSAQSVKENHLILIRLQRMVQVVTIAAVSYGLINWILMTMVRF